MADYEWPEWAKGFQESSDKGFVHCPSCGAQGVLPERDGSSLGSEAIHVPDCEWVRGGDEEQNYHFALDRLRKINRMGFTHNPGGGEFVRGELRFQLHMQNNRDDYERFVLWLKKRGA